MLLSEQEFERIDSCETLYNLQSDLHELRPVKPLKVRTEIDIIASVNDIVLTMYYNKGFPADEGSAHTIEQQFYIPAKERTTISVKLANYSAKEEFWDLPPGSTS